MLAVSVLIVLSLFLSIAVSPWPAKTVLARSAPWFLVFAFWFWFISLGLPWWGAYRTSRYDASVRGEITHSVSSHGLQIQTIAASVKLTWAHILKAVETADYFLYYYQPSFAYFTPKAAMPAATAEAFRQALTDSLHDRFTRDPTVRNVS
jgi:YcxB-like protein